MNKVYDNPKEWYHPEIDYDEMLTCLRWTKDPMMEKSVELQGIWGYDFPLRHVDMFHFVLDVRGGDIQSDGIPPFQWWNKTFNGALSKLLHSINAKVIVEVAAGDGMLTKILLDRGFNVYATDSYRWTYEKQYSPVEKLTYGRALKKYSPDVVICSWMPLGTNWTPTFRETESVMHYIQMGEVEQCCGGDWKKRKGWTVGEIEECSKYALCRTDDISFRNGNGNEIEFSLFHSKVYLSSRNGVE